MRNTPPLTPAICNTRAFIFLGPTARFGATTLGRPYARLFSIRNVQCAMRNWNAKLKCDSEVKDTPFFRVILENVHIIANCELRIAHYFRFQHLNNQKRPMGLTYNNRINEHEIFSIMYNDINGFDRFWV